MSIYLPLFLSCSCTSTCGVLRRGGLLLCFDRIHWPKRGSCFGALIIECGTLVRGYVVGLREAARDEYMSLLLVVYSTDICSEATLLMRLVRGRMLMSFLTGERVDIVTPRLT